VWIVIAVLAFGATRSRLGYLRARKAQHQAERETAVARAVSGFLTGMLTWARPGAESGEGATVSEVLDAAAERLASERPYAHDPEVASAVRVALGDAYVAIGAYEKALVLYAGTVGKVHAKYTGALEGAAAAHVRRGELAKAETTLQEVLALEAELYTGADESQRAYTLASLASVLADQGRWDESLALHGESMALRRKYMGEESAPVAMSMSDIGVVLDRAGRWAEAEDTLRTTLAMSRRVFGDDHPQTADVRVRLASALAHQGQWTEAEATLRDAWEILSARLGPGNPRSRHAAEMLAEHYRETGAGDLADTWRRRAGGAQ